MNKAALIVASHGQMAKYALDSAEMVVGKQENCGVLTISMDLTLADAVKQLDEEFSRLDHRAGTVILVDILGGTPSNVCGRLALLHDNVLVLSGLNLPMLIDLLMNRERSLEEVAASLEESYHNGFSNITQLFNERKDEDECEIL